MPEAIVPTPVSRPIPALAAARFANRSKRLVALTPASVVESVSRFMPAGDGGKRHFFMTNLGSRPGQPEGGTPNGAAGARSSSFRLCPGGGGDKLAAHPPFCGGKNSACTADFFPYFRGDKRRMDPMEDLTCPNCNVDVSAEELKRNNLMCPTCGFDMSDTDEKEDLDVEDDEAEDEEEDEDEDDKDDKDEEDEDDEDDDKR